MRDAAKNEDREIWREREGDYYADSIHVTAQGAIAIDCGGHVIVMPVRNWHAIAKAAIGLMSLNSDKSDIEPKLTDRALKASATETVSWGPKP
jgi:hypothetical protein